MSEEEIKKYFNERKNSNSVGHAYLFSNTSYEELENTIKYILCSIIFENDTEIYDNPDIYFVEPEKNIIKKEKILDLEEKISKTSQVNDSKVYIIKECDKLNDSAANCLLKTLEEPSESVYAFLITSSIDNVISTIKSRCQIIQCETDNKLYDRELINKAIPLIKELEEIGSKAIAYNSNDFYKSFEKVELKDILNIMELFYKDCLNKIYGLKLDTFDEYEDVIEEVVKNNKYDKIIKKIKILNENIDLLKYNLNGNLFIDKLLIEIGRL